MFLSLWTCNSASIADIMPSSVSQEDPQRTVQTFIDLVQRHEQSFYTFVHNVHSKGQGLFDSLMSWIELFLSYARDGLHRPVDLEFILPHAGAEREAIMAEVDSVAQYHYRLKIAHEEKIRRRFNKGIEATDGQAVEEAALLDSVMASLSLGQTAVGDAGELGDEESQDEDGGDEEEEGASEGSSVRSAPIAVSVPMPSSSPTPRRSRPPTPELTTETEVPFLSPNGGKDKERRGSGSSSRSSLSKIKSGLALQKKSPMSEEKDREHESGKGERRSPLPRSTKPSKQGVRKARKARRAAAQELMIAPETKALEELRPLFVEIVSCFFRLLRGKGRALKWSGS